jgi:hypothetical protein
MSGLSAVGETAPEQRSGESIQRAIDFKSLSERKGPLNRLEPSKAFLGLLEAV